MKTAILIDGGFYQKRARALFGEKQPVQRADELITYCLRHLKDNEDYRDFNKTINKHPKNDQYSQLYRIFYYDCPPSEKNIYHPLTQKTVSLLRSPMYTWAKGFHASLVKKRKVA